MLGRWSSWQERAPYAVDVLQLLEMMPCSAAHGAACGTSGGEVQEHSAQLFFHFRKEAAEDRRLK